MSTLAATTSGTAVAGAKPGRAHGFAGTGELLRLIARRDRVRVLVWVVAITGLVLTSAASIIGLYDTPQSLAGYAAIAEDNATIIIQAGPGYGLDDPTTGSVLMNEVGIWTIIAVAIMSAFMVSRHTRAEEESDRAELLRSLPTGRHAASAATMVAALVTNAVVGAVVAVGLIASGLDATGSVAFGATLVGAGTVFAAVTLVTAQVASTSRASTGLAMVVLGLAFIIRAVGDVSGGALSWLSPIGWAQAIRAFAGERWWVLLLPLVASAGLLAVAVALAGRRDFGSGLLPQRVGRAEARSSLSSTFALSVRVLRGVVVGWAAGVVVLGVFYGIVADQAEQMLEDSPEMEDFFAQLGQGSIVDAFLSVSVLIMGLLAGGFVVAAVLRLHTEESAGRADPLLATPTPRRTWAASHLAASGLGMLVVLLAGGLATGIGAAISLGEPSRVLQLLGATLTMATGAAVMAGIAFLLWSVAPRWSLLAWALFAVPVVIGLLGEALGLPDWALNISPFQHVPAMPAASFALLPVAVLVVVSAALVATGLFALHRRDMGRG
ncbi:ABC transporter permease [Rhabdothermincola salaria]|uniref:ABC transporter permease n=1 Tax=Rhabdothermincola salaria TaxID=2903142 RepID=UPI001E407043|nr:hypothetical protein [Rhabdothermincola salaria]MCD9624335.1 hypothetical protein [Rhabdothermincola salaria]